MNAYLILGNGFSIDLINHLQKDDKICLTNLFSNGERVKWPVSDTLGFLSYKYCPALTRLGAKSTNNADETLKIIQSVITCANVYASIAASKRPKHSNGVENIYIKAYNELVSYLRCLFIYYNELIKDDELDVDEWDWFKQIKHLYDSKKIDKIYIITYNYDIWLERILNKYSIDYSTYMGGDSDKKIEIIKPHGSISFIHKTLNELDAFELKNNFEHIDAEITDFEESLDDLLCNPSVIPLIPPAGQSSRYENSWSASIRNKIKESCQRSSNNDILFLGGISYWFVDREEIDEILINLNNEANLYLVNPEPPSDFFAVLTTIYKNVIHIPFSTDNLGAVL